MIASTIPDEGNTALRTLTEQIFEESNSFLGITRAFALNKTLLSIEINGTIISLPAPLIDYGHFDALVGFAPNIPAQISP